MPAAGRRRGLVKFYNQRKGWGFITPTTGQEVFVHRSGLADDALHPLQEGDLVEFALDETGRGPQAVAVTRLAAAGD
jgi:CspA family cold shock protein